MKSHLIFKTIIFSLALSVAFTTGVFAQAAKKTDEPAATKDPRKEFNEADRPEENYLARFTAISVSERLIKDNLEQIYMLKVISTNFKDQGWDKDYQVIYDGYKKGVGLFYKRDVIYARVELERNRKAISELYKKIADFYKKQTEQMASDCADTILSLSLDERSQSDINKNKTVFQNMMRLRIAYGQLDDAQNNYTDGLYTNSIFHYRVAKAYGIKIMEDLDPEKSKGKYDIHKADNMNRVLNPETAKAETKKAEEKPATK
jgi:hypothetical protein